MEEVIVQPDDAAADDDRFSLTESGCLIKRKMLRKLYFFLPSSKLKDMLGH
jgi:hypothetical protein